MRIGIMGRRRARVINDFSPSASRSPMTASDGSGYGPLGGSTQRAPPRPTGPAAIDLNSLSLRDFGEDCELEPALPALSRPDSC